jgi:hypothetical protein
LRSLLALFSIADYDLPDARSSTQLRTANPTPVTFAFARLADRDKARIVLEDCGLLIFLQRALARDRGSR